MIYTDTQTLLRHIKQIKVGKDISNKAIAQKLNLTSSAISGIFNQSNISIEKLNSLCEAIDCNIDITFIDKKTGTPL